MYKANNNLVYLLYSSITVISLLSSFVLCDEPELEIHNTFKPENCKRKAKVTDVLTLHYKGTLESGEVFDSR